MESARAQRSQHLERVLPLVVVVAGFAGVLGTIPGFGPLSLSGVLTVLLAALLSVGLLLYRSYPARLLLRLSPYLAFLVWLAFRSAWSPPGFYGVQQLLVYATFGLCLLSAGLAAARNPDRTTYVINVAVRWTSVLALGLVAVSVSIRGLHGPWLSGQRVVALLGLFPVSWYLAKLYSGMPHSLAPISVWLGVIVLSSSRMATAAAILLLTLVTSLKIWRRPSGALAVLSLVLLALGGTIFLFSRVPQFQEHLLTGDTGYMAVGNVQINVAGRAVAWQAIAKSARESPIVGKGVGSSYLLLEPQFELLSHPHNDYLRIWHDLGFIGLGLFLFALVSWGSILARGWYRADSDGRPPEYMKLAGLLAVLSLMLAMVTDNPVVSAYVMAPMGILIGAGLGTVAHRRAPRTNLSNLYVTEVGGYRAFAKLR